MRSVWPATSTCAVLARCLDAHAVIGRHVATRVSAEPITLWIVLRGETKGLNAGRGEIFVIGPKQPRLPPF